MCKAFSCIVTRQGEVFWQAGADSHDQLIEKFKLKDDVDPSKDPLGAKFVKVEVTPDNPSNSHYPYLYPENNWTLRVDEERKPRWFTSKHEDVAQKALSEWKSQVYRFNLGEARSPVHSFKIEPPTTIGEEQIKLLKVWASVEASVRDSAGDSVWASVEASVRDSVGDSVRDSVWASVRDSVGDSVRDSAGDSVWVSVWDSVRDSAGAYIGSLFPEINVWKYTDVLKKQHPEITGYPFQSAVDLWRQGLVPSFDGKTWRLHSKNGVVYEISAKKLKETK